MRKFYSPLLAITFLFSLGFHSLALAQTEYDYDAAGRLTRVKSLSGFTVFYTYDAAGNITTKTVAENQPPTARDDLGFVAAGNSTTIVVLGNDTDPDGDALQIASYTQGTKGSVGPNPQQQMVYLANFGSSGKDYFTYTITDGFGHEATATVTVSILQIP